MLLPTNVRRLSGVSNVVTTTSTAPVMPPAEMKLPTLNGRNTSKNEPAAKLDNRPAQATASDRRDQSGKRGSLDSEITEIATTSVMFKTTATVFAAKRRTVGSISCRARTRCAPTTKPINHRPMIYRTIAPTICRPIVTALSCTVCANEFQFTRGRLLTVSSVAMRCVPRVIRRAMAKRASHIHVFRAATVALAGFILNPDCPAGRLSTWPTVARHGPAGV